MAAKNLRLPGTVEEIAGGPEGPAVGAFFDLDGTLVAGYTARYLTEERMKAGEYGPVDVLRTLGVMVGGGGLNPDTFAELLDLGAHTWAGRTVEDLDEMALRLYKKKVAGRIYPEMREIVRAHQDAGHTVVLTSSATTFQVQPVADALGIEHVVCNRFEDDDGVLTGHVAKPVIWGDTKAYAAQQFAADHGVDLDRSYFYADGDEDVALMYLVGKPRPTNPGETMAKIAGKRGWPVTRLSSRGAGSSIRTLIGFSTFLPIAGLGAAKGLLARNRRSAINFITDHWSTLMLRINGVEMNVTGRENLTASRPAVFLFNHRNGFDPFIAVSLIGRDFTSVAKAELKDDPMISAFGRFADIAFVERDNTKSAVEALKPIEAMADKGLSVLIAPEGTRLDTREVGPFKKGAFRIAMHAGIPVVPIVIRNAEMLGARDAVTINPGTVDVAVLPPVPTADWKLDEIDERIAEVRQMYLDTLADWPSDDE
ncbi:HAD-IB family hydrolase [Tomitella gaofuii]|uniref:HAD-IB family hydrolase n=1 Tax=Tomitella gaofuii TaxID=2760083 RepID=UPI001C715D92|nr:HAD-IB family hydrolase [Tomitella gaofuii]